MLNLQLTFHCLLHALLLHLHLLHSQTVVYDSSAVPSTTWTNSPSTNMSYSDGTTINPIFLRRNPSSLGPAFGFGFYCANSCDVHLLATFIHLADPTTENFLVFIGIAQVVWSANRDAPVGWYATLEFTEDGHLLLKDVDGSLVWSINSTGNSVASMSLTESGNLVLLDGDGVAVWQSFDHPTDTLLSGQSLVSGQKLTANASATNWTGGQPYISYTPNIGFQAFVGSNPPQKYYSFPMDRYSGSININSKLYPCLLNVTSNALTFLSNSTSSDWNISNPPASPVQFLRLEFDGHLKLYEWSFLDGWYPKADVIELDLGDCQFPMVCGAYGICRSGQCGACPQDSSTSTSYFKQVDYPLVDSNGCAAITPLSCTSKKRHGFLELPDISNFNYMDDALLHPNSTTKETCKQECLNNCSCKAAFFKYGAYETQGSCYLQQEVFSLMSIQPQKVMFNSTAYIKIHYASSKLPTFKIVGIAIGALLGLLVIGSFSIVVYKRGRTWEEKMQEDEDLPQLPGMSARFSYIDLKCATQNFIQKLGSGGFGTVFGGRLADGKRVAVKKLESVRQGKREFLAEVETIGSIHHLCLVRLVGYCAERSHRLLVYEYMHNGSLDNWIFPVSKKHFLTWEMRCNIIRDVAKGLLYLHEDCRQKILHLDIKPQNILLDSNFNAKVSDFGLAKLIDRDQSTVVTMMRGTPGYLAPEWLTSIITEKVDVYSFGVVIMEIVCGRKNLDSLRLPEHMLLLPILREMAIKGRLLDLIDEDIRDTDCKAKEMEKMLQLAVWCSQNNPNKRPSMSMIVKVLEGAMDVNSDFDCDFASPPMHSASTTLIASELSGPR